MTKNFDDLTEEELLALAPDDVQRYIDRESAEAGIPLVEDPGPEPDKAEIAGDLKIFSVGGLTFTDRFDALAAMDKIAVLKSRVDLGYISGPSYKQMAVRPGELEIREGLVFQEQTADARAAVIADHEQRKAAWDKRRRAYESARSRRLTIQNEITQRVREARQKQWQRDDVRRTFAKYLDLAEGNRRTAGRLVLAAHHDAKELCPDLFTFTTNDPDDFPLSGKRHYINADEEAGTIEVEL